MTGEGAPGLRSVELWRVQLPLRHAHRAAHGTEDRRDLILVSAAFDDGVVGWGECSTLARPTYTSEHTAGAWAVLRDELVPALLAGRPLDVVGHPLATAGVVTALTDAVLRRVERPLSVELAATLGANPLTAVPQCAVVGRRNAIDDLGAHTFPEIVGWHDPKASTPLRREMLRWSQVSQKAAFDDVFVGGMLEMGVGRAAALAVAALPGCTLPTDLGPSLSYYDQDITEPLGLDAGGRILVPDGPGIGRTPIPAHLEAAAVDRLLLER